MQQSSIAPRLQREQVRIAPVEPHELLVTAALDDATTIEHCDLVRHAHRGEAVRDENGDAIAGELPEMLEYLGLRLCVHGGRGLIEHQDIGPGTHEGTRQRDLLPLATGELAAIAEPFT